MLGGRVNEGGGSGRTGAGRAARSPPADPPCPQGWLVAAYSLQVAGDLCLTPVGDRVVTKLFPYRIAGVTIGAAVVLAFLIPWVRRLTGGVRWREADSPPNTNYWVDAGGGSA